MQRHLAQVREAVKPAPSCLHARRFRTARVCVIDLSIDAGAMSGKRQKSRRDEDKSPEDDVVPVALGRAHSSSAQRDISRDTDARLQKKQTYQTYHKETNMNTKGGLHQNNNNKYHDT